MSTDLQDWIIRRFISRADAVAIQNQSGAWTPLREENRNDAPLIPWNREILQNHLDGKTTAGHYMLNQANETMLFAFDIDFATDGMLPSRYDEDGVPRDFVEVNPREAWWDRSNPHRNYMKYQLRHLSHKIAGLVYKELEVPPAVAYSGNKGVHVYGFTGVMAANEARIAAEIIMKALNDSVPAGTNFQLSRGTFEWRDTNPDPDFSYRNFTIEVFPKQDSISESGFGNLMALPLGINRKRPDDPKMFIDMRAPMNVLAPVDPIWALSTDNPWKD